MARPRDPEVDSRILAATRALIAESGVANVTIDAVAVLADVSRPTIYRRWATRAELMFAAQSNASVSVEFPDTGSLRSDLIEAVGHLVDVMSSSDRSVAAEQFGRMIADAAFAEHVWSHRWEPDRDKVLRLWERGIARGEIAVGSDGAAVIDDLVALCLFRVFLAHQTLDEGDIASIVDRVLDGATLAPRQP